MSIMITGGTGYLGSYLARHLVRQKGEKGLVLFDMYPNTAKVQDLQNELILIQGDVTDIVQVLRVMKQYNVTKVVHLAYSLRRDIQANPPRGMEINAIGTSNIFEASLHMGVKRVVYASSSKVYGDDIATLYNEPLTEDPPPSPTNIYGACKRLNELVAETYHQTYGLDVIGMRPTATFGFGKKRAPLGDFQEVPGRLQLAALGEPVVLPTDEQYFDWMYATDAAEAFYLALSIEKPPYRIYNMSSEALPMREISHYMKSLLPKAKITISTDPISRLPLINNTRLRAGLGFVPLYSVIEGLRESLSSLRVAAGLSPL